MLQHKNQLTGLELRWYEYLKNLSEASDGRFDFHFAGLLKKVREQLHNFLEHPVDPPDVCEGEDGGLQLVWERGDLHLCVDIIDSNNVEWFLKNQTTGDYWGAEGFGVEEFPPHNLQDKLKSQNFK